MGDRRRVYREVAFDDKHITQDGRPICDICDLFAQRDKEYWKMTAGSREILIKRVKLGIKDEKHNVQRHSGLRLLRASEERLAKWKEMLTVIETSQPETPDKIELL